MINVDIVIIDSGVDKEAINRNCEVVGGVYIDDNGKTIAVNDNDYTDNNGHGTAVANMILMEARKIRLFVIKIFEQGKKPSENALCSALQYVSDNIMCSLINISCGIVRCTNVMKMESICTILVEKGINIISAFDNNGRMSYPAAFKCVIGIDCSFSCYKLNDFQVADGGVVDVRGMAYTMRIPSIRGSYVEDGGTSFVCGYITGIIWNQFKCKAIKKNEIMEFLADKAIKRYNIPKKVEKSRIVIRKAILLPFNKEMHALVRYADLLGFSIEGIYDLKYSGNIGKLVSDVIQEEICYTRKIEDISLIDWENGDFDTIICGSFSKTKEALGKDVKGQIINNCRFYGKQIYMFDEDGYEKSLDVEVNHHYQVYVPSVLEDDIIYNQFGKLHEIGRPVLAILGTSPKQGKYSLQLELRRRFLQNGYSVGQLGTEPSALLFGMDEIYNFGFNSTVHIAGTDAVIYVNEMMYRIEKKNPDIIITGSQSQTVQMSSGNIGFYPVAQYEYLLGIQADTVLLCVTVGDSISYVERTVQFIEAINSCKVIGFVLFPFKFRNVMGYLASYKSELDIDTIDEYENRIKNHFPNVKIYNIRANEAYDDIYQDVLKRYSGK